MTNMIYGLAICHCIQVGGFSMVVHYRATFPPGPKTFFDFINNVSVRTMKMTMTEKRTFKS